MKHKDFQLRIKAKKALVIVPHEDDELLVAGNLICYLLDNEVETHVVFSTNGDYFTQARVRYREALKALSVLGVNPQNVFFLGYSDFLNSDDHSHYFYNINGTTMSHSGKNYTYGACGFDDYAFMKSGVHHGFNRKNFEEDLYDVIDEIRPELLICCAFDEHPDHRMLSICFQKALNRLLKNTVSYNPQVLKRFAYPLSYFAIEDYTQWNCKSTLRPQVGSINKYNFDIIGSFNYLWEDRIRIPTENHRTKFCRALLKHKSQHLNARFKGIVNSDEVFWEYRSDNIALHASISVSSGEASYINDSQYYLVDDIDSKIPSLQGNCWLPSKEDKNPWIIFNWGELRKIERIKIFAGFVPLPYPCGISIYIDGRLVHEDQCLASRGKAIESVFNSGIVCRSMTVRLSNYDNSFPGISEIEVFSEAKSKSSIIQPFILLEINGCITTHYYADKHSESFDLDTYLYGLGAIESLEVSRGNARIENNKIYMGKDENLVEITARAADGRDTIIASVVITRESAVFFAIRNAASLRKIVSINISKILLRFEAYRRFVRGHSIHESAKWFLQKLRKCRVSK